MNTLRNSKVIVIGGSSGVGRATVLALLERGAEVVAVGREQTRLEALRSEASRALEIRALDATDRGAVDRLFTETQPRHVVLTAGTRPFMALLDEHTWESFSKAWNEDVKMAFEMGQAMFRHGLAEGSSLVIVSSGAGLGGSPLSGGYAGAKRTQMFLTSYLQRVAQERGKKLRFVAIVPRQLIVDTQTGHDASLAYARLTGVTQEKYLQRFEVPLLASGVAVAIVQALEGEFADGSVVAVTGKGTALV